MQTLRRIWIQTLMLLALYESVRLLFWLVNHSQFQGTDGNILALAFAQGARFDLVAIVITNAVLFLLYFTPLPERWRRGQEKILAWAFGLINGCFLAVNIVDVEYYRFTGKRFTRDSLAIGQDLLAQAGQIAVYYWYYTLLILALTAGLIWFSLKNLRRVHRDSKVSLAVGLILLLASCVLGGRGGWQHKPLIPAQAYAGETGKLGILILNSSFTLLKSSDEAFLHAVQYMPDNAARAMVAARNEGPVIPLPRKPKNVVLVILESFGKEYVLPPEGHPTYAPFLKSLAEKGSSFPNAYANGRRSIDALPSIFAGIPAWMEAAFITSPYQTNRVQGYPEILRKNGVHTQFFHGGENGTMFFDVMADRFGFEQYIGEKEYPDPKDHDGRWGIFDEPFMHYAAQRMGGDGRPFFASVFTLTSHHPYTIPPQHKDRFPKGQLEIHESLGYTDLALQKFYETARQQPWFADTLFIFTADHTQKSQFPEYETAPGRYRVPLIFIMNDQPLPFADLDRPVQHMDIMPTVLDAVGIQAPAHSRFGSSLLQNTSRPGVVLQEGPSFVLVGVDRLLMWNVQTDEKARYDWPQDTLLKVKQMFTPEMDQDLLYVRAQMQCFNNGMVQNTLVW
ncbi:MAG TPA: LTA synthase family protein [Oligoflexus sp.]|uniref:LTA synthase family protein n=1 Tax=Oligoflexus sp. TaxID=1971216 RepID=UPI002D438385|nr:LTA synthase family protein [Oligoflexus sp.]HYX39625.1 LTA synthase family protein [Oligoflexus sp.]